MRIRRAGKWLKVLLLALVCIAGTAMAESEIDIYWQGESLRAELCTREPALVDYEPIPASGELILIRLKGEDIALSKAQAQMDSLYLSGPSGDTHTPVALRADGRVLTADTKTDETCDRLDAIFYLQVEQRSKMDEYMLCAQSGRKLVMIELGAIPKQEYAIIEDADGAQKDFADRLAHMTGEIDAFSLFHAAYAVETDPMMAYIAALTYANAHGMEAEFARAQSEIVAAQCLMLPGAEMKAYMDKYRLSERDAQKTAYRAGKAANTPVREEVLALIRDDAAQFDYRGALWMNEGFQAFYQTTYDAFTPANPQPNTYLIVLTDSSAAKDTALNQASENPLIAYSNLLGSFQSALRSMQTAFAEAQGDHLFKITGNPDRASVFLVFDLAYPKAGNYTGTLNTRVSVFNCALSVTAYDPCAGEALASISALGQYGQSVSIARGVSAVWHPWPNLFEEDGAPEFIASLLDFANERAGKAAYAQNDNPPPAAPSDEEQLQALFDSLLDGETDAWKRAILEAGWDRAEWTDTSVSLYIRSFNPDIDQIGAYSTGDAVHYLARMFERMREYDVKVTLELTNGIIDENGKGKLKNQSGNIAAASKAAFESANVSAALMDWLAPKPADNVKRGADIRDHMTDAFIDFAYGATDAAYDYLTEDALAALHYAQSGCTVNAKNGPHAIAVSIFGADPDSLLSDAYERAMNEAKTIPYLCDADSEEINAVFVNALLDSAFAMAGKSEASFSTVLDVDAFYYEDEINQDYVAFIDSYPFCDVQYEFMQAVWDLPSLPSVEYPANGWLSGVRVGTQVTLIPPAGDTEARYIKVFDANTEKEIASAFMRPGMRITLYIPQGLKHFLIAAGEDWYGEKYLFLDEGTYSRTEDISIMSSDYYHEITLGVSTGGNLGSYSADMSDFWPEE